MGGVGSFTRQNRTLYIGRIKENRNTAETIERHFEEFGEIERSKSPRNNVRSTRREGRPLISIPCPRLSVKILQSRGVAFVTYIDEITAQFAKEAMMHQSLDEDEVINVRYVLKVRSAATTPS